MNATLQCESVIRQYQRAEEKLDNAVDTISGKFDTINGHIDQVMEDAPTKLKVSVNVSDADWQKMHELHGQWMEQERQMLADHNQQQETIWQKHSSRLSEIVKNNEGVWISTRVFYIVGSLSLLSIITSIGESAFYFTNKKEIVNIYSYITNPTSATGSSFSNDIYYNGTLHIPPGTLSKYQAADGWKKILWIEEDIATGINTINGNKTLTNHNVDWYTLDGKQLTAPQPGINIRRTENGKTEKVIVK